MFLGFLENMDHALHHCPVPQRISVALEHFMSMFYLGDGVAKQEFMVLSA